MNHLLKKWAFHSSALLPPQLQSPLVFPSPWLRPPGTSVCPWTRARPREGSKGAPGSPRGCVLYKIGARWMLEYRASVRIYSLRWPVRCVYVAGAGAGAGGWHRQTRRHCEKRSQRRRTQSWCHSRNDEESKRSWKRAMLENTVSQF